MNRGEESGSKSKGRLEGSTTWALDCSRARGDFARRILCARDSPRSLKYCNTATCNLDKTPPSQHTLHCPLYHLLERSSSLSSSLQHVPHNTLHSLSHHIALNIDAIADLLQRDDRTGLSVRNEHNAEEPSAGLVVLLSGLGDREMGEGEGGTVEGDVAFWDERGVELEREGHEETD
jgi:hypothetical protein